jgi:ABC-type polysaccharide/polyol phosphate transport system ATPase subunit
MENDPGACAPTRALIDSESAQPEDCSASRGSAAIEMLQLTRRFGSLIAVDGLTLTVPAASIFGLLGPNGAGKSTTIKMLATLLPASSGVARVAGFDVTRQPYGVRRHIGYVPQVLSADGALTGYENLLLLAKLYGVPGSERNDRIRDALEFTGLTDGSRSRSPCCTGRPSCFWTSRQWGSIPSLAALCGIISVPFVASSAPPFS